MGTNYYLEMQEPCPHCNRPYEQMHIGKSSAGWCFSLHVDPEKGINTLEDWQLIWEGKRIFDEYGEEISHITMLSRITERSWRQDGRKDEMKVPVGYKNWSTFHLDNHSEFGPNGLLRSKVDDRHCIGHGPGTWDYIIGDFS